MTEKLNPNGDRAGINVPGIAVPGAAHAGGSKRRFWQRESAIKGVAFKIANPDAGHDAQHNSWMQEKVDAGWFYGDVKDAEAKTHPCIVPFEQLPEFQQKKDALFCAIVEALK
ncbi:MAG: RyR domain-containing protein [Leadbetterella sp.]